jgi:molybdate transport system ATP-binding protein
LSCLDIAIRLSCPAFDSLAELQLRAGETTVLLGPSGGGKSTLLRALAGLERPRAGRIALNSNVWFDSRKGIHLPPRQRKAGLMFQHYALFPHLSVSHNLGFALQGLNCKERRKQVEQWLTLMHIRDIARAKPSHISGGQRQRVALARTLAADPDVLLLDEPFSAVDSALRHHLRQLFREVTQGRTRPVLMVTHDLEDVRELADQVGVMVSGQLRRFGPVAEVLSNPEDLEVARILGWKNLLPVAHFEAGLACGSWGCLPAPRPDRSGRFWLGIEPRHWRIVKQKGLPGIVEHNSPFGPYQEMTCRLRDRQRVYLHRPHNDSPMSAGTRLQLQVSAEHLVLLSSKNSEFKSSIARPLSENYRDKLSFKLSRHPT